MNDLLIKKIIESEECTLETFFQEKGICTFLNPVSYLEAVKNESVFADFDYVFADGGLLAFMIKLIYKKKVIRRSFDMTSMAKTIFEYASDNGKSVYFIGTTQDIIEKSVAMIINDNPSLQVCGFRNGYFSSFEERKNALAEIISMSPDILVVGMGILNQEEFLLEAKKSGFNGLGFSCGGFLHQYMMRGSQYYPKWINRMNLRFFYRMYKESYTIKRYAKAFFLFPVVFLKRKFA